ncbi:phosphoribosylformylglycinamidine synthase I [Methanogenium sp. MK-MG]|uniref:phosphoribosylformylglycinamidine synthase I n=1 Tax=Methanogenium sp. MK-MG TaxID=2599926 RepID=UPI0013EA0B2D|nr:phosphoribosylformylglycinamidine synthase I [Methanogenium sp. MK-MG]KAF1076668.1 Phosphoribosylformylglycinamidine synthase subunit PurQ [Methanogenium sp. MK-MG]
MRFAVLQFGGSNCDQDAQHVIEDVCGVDCDLVWYKEGFNRSYDAIVIPGGFSYGDYLRAGAIATRTPVMQDVRRHAAAGGLVLGICNGAQIGAESGLIPGVFTINKYPKFICEWVHLKVENASSPFTSGYTEGDIIRIPIAHKEGRYVAGEGVPQRLLDEGRVAFRFCDAAGNCTPESNPNGSALNITGVLGEDQNVLLMMPHPERAAESVLGSEDGKKLFDSMIDYCEGR